MRNILTIAVLAAGLPILAACGPDETADIPKPVNLTQEASGYFCNMTVVDHPGPKAHAFVKGSKTPFWFTSARDAVAFAMLPESANGIAAIYVTDMGTVAVWEEAAKGEWIEARTAFYVIGSSKRGGMGAPEAVPFAEEARAKLFQAEFGGEVLSYSDIPRDYVLEADQAANVVGSGS